MNIPYVIEQNNRGERAYDIYSRLLKDRILFLGSELNSYTASLIVAQMLYLEADNPEADISFYINSMGGHIADGLAIYDTMQYIESPVQTICIGRAYNIAALLLASGQKGKRIALKNAQILLHQPLGGLSGQASDIQIQTQEVLRIKESFSTVLAYHTAKKAAEINKDLDREFYLNSKEALSYGIVDRVMEKRSLSKKKPLN